MEDTNLIVVVAPLDPAFVGTPQEFVDHIVERTSIKSPSGFFNVVIADAAPISNQGLLLLGGLKPYAWDTGTSQYVPVDITDSLYVEPAGKWVLTSDNGTWQWKSISDLFTWGSVGIGSLVAGAPGTIGWHQ